MNRKQKMPLQQAPASLNQNENQTEQKQSLLKSIYQ